MRVQAAAMSEYIEQMAEEQDELSEGLQHACDALQQERSARAEQSDQLEEMALLYRMENMRYRHLLCEHDEVATAPAECLLHLAVISLVCCRLVQALAVPHLLSPRAGPGQPGGCVRWHHGAAGIDSTP